MMEKVDGVDSFWERLSAQDHSFLVAEDRGAAMHVGAVQIFAAGALRTESGGIDIAAIRRTIASKLPLIPRYRQKLIWTPVENLPAWVDDAAFDIERHVRHISLPRPGTMEQLWEMAGRLFEETLDRSRPLWEMWVIEGLEGGRYAMINRVHHSMMDGSAGSELANLLYSLTPDQEEYEVLPFAPRPAPTGWEMLAEAAMRRAGLLRTAVEATVGAVTASDLLGRASAAAASLADMSAYSRNPVSATPLNGHVGPARAFRGFEIELADVKAMSRATGTTVNDVVLAVVTGAVREHLQHHGIEPSEVTFRFSTPVNLRSAGEKGALAGNRVGSWIVPAPLDRKRGLDRLEAVHTKTTQLKNSSEAAVVDMVMSLAEFAPNVLLPLGVSASSGPMSMVVTNVPGPQFPLYMQGSKLESLFCQGPVLQGTGICLALFSYDGKICLGFNADPGLVTDLDVFVAAVKAAFLGLEREIEESVLRPPVAATAALPNAREEIAPARRLASARGQRADDAPSYRAPRAATA